MQIKWIRTAAVFVFSLWCLKSFTSPFSPGLPLPLLFPHPLLPTDPSPHKRIQRSELTSQKGKRPKTKAKAKSIPAPTALPSLLPFPFPPSTPLLTPTVTSLPSSCPFAPPSIFASHPSSPTLSSYITPWFSVAMNGSRSRTFP